MGYGVLRGEGEEGVHSSGEDCEAGCLVRAEGALQVDQRPVLGRKMTRMRSVYIVTLAE